MPSRTALPALCLLGASAVVFACGGPQLRSGADASARSARPSLALRHGGARNRDTARPRAATRRVDDDADTTTSVSATVGIMPGRDGVQLALAVVNESRRRIELDFPDGQTREFVVLDAAGREVWRWSEGRMFTQSVQNKLLGVGDTVTYAERWPNAKPGRYTAVAVLRSANYPVERRVTFDLPGTTHVATTAAAPTP